MIDGKGWIEQDFGVIGKWWPNKKIEGWGGLTILEGFSGIETDNGFIYNEGYGG